MARSDLLTRDHQSVTGSNLYNSVFAIKLENFNLNPSWIIKLMFAFAHREIGILPIRNVESHYATTLGAINHQN